MNSYVLGMMFEMDVLASLRCLDFGKTFIPRWLYSKELGRKTQTDMVFVTKYCVYSIEVKSARKLSGNIDDSRWWSSAPNTTKPIGIVNPYLQNMHHIMSMKLHLYRDGLSYIPFENILVIKDDTLLKSDCDNFYTLSELRRKLVEDYKTNSAKPDLIDVNRIYKVLK